MLDRHKLILREIICNYYGTSLKELSELTEVSEKTLKNDISVIEGMLMEEGLPLNYLGDRIMIPFAEKKKYLDAYYDLTWRDYRDPLMEEQEDRKVGMYLLITLTFLRSANNRVRSFRFSPSGPERRIPFLVLISTCSFRSL